MLLAVIIILCYLMVEIIKKTPLKNEFLPLIAATLGVALGVLAYCIVPGSIPGDSLILAIVQGLMCGLASTGGNQIFKQAVKYLGNKVNINIPTSTEEENKNE